MQIKTFVAPFITIILLWSSSNLFADSKADLLKAIQENKIEEVQNYTRSGIVFQEIYSELKSFDKMPSIDLGALLLDNDLAPNLFIEKILAVPCTQSNPVIPSSIINEQLIEQRNKLVELALTKGARANDLLSIAITQTIPTDPINGSYKSLIIPHQENLIQLALNHKAKFSSVIDKVFIIGMPALSISAATLMLNNSYNPTRLLNIVLLENYQALNAEGIYEVTPKLTKLYDLITLTLEKKQIPNKYVSFTLFPQSRLVSY